MELTTWLTYVGVISALIAFPGPVALLCMHHGLRHGRQRALATVIGGATASLVLMGLSSLGLGAILATSELAFTFLKGVGAAYLIYLGVQAWRAPMTAASMTGNAAQSSQPIERTGTRALLWRGFTVGISNPKDLLFFGALFPGFIDLGASQLPQFAILSLTWLAIDLTTMSSYATMGSGIGRWFRSPRRVKLFNRTTGSLFIAAGGTLAASHR
ncbi:LysE family transporter [Chromohalobacter sp. 296-RDG]|uniref:LysE family translocator n=1 Tax=Chromohalobacter sp. 296-RDG TaxID=2994062 RepID=UPI002468D5E7|nr:LysE family transporter [Chromohalobacter sp. 296-RDG]